ncbi:MAG: helix-turn-helix domain-containing protein [Ignavibacteriales bacterium]|nr:helix-turn-helix domain-containing protein [Ignavibacteriales bacterium]
MKKEIPPVDTEQKEILQKLNTLEDLLKKKNDKPLTFKEACAYLGYAPSYLYKLTYRKVIPHYKPTGKMIFFSKAELDEWVFKSRNQNSEISRQNETNDTKKEETLIKDSNQIEMELKDEVVVEFPRKKKR